MSFEWSRFLDLAGALAATPAGHAVEQQGEREAALRSALSRAYYAAFHHAKGYLRAKDPLLDIANHGASHEQVPSYLKDRGRTAEERGAATKLEKLKRLRKWADYERSERPRLDAAVEQALKDAASILTNLVVPSA